MNGLDVTSEHGDSSRLCALADVGEGGKELCIEGSSGPEWLMLFHREGELTAWRNVCPHQGRALNWAPDKFLFSNEGHLVCSHHGATFELPAGRCLSGPCEGASLTPVDVHIEDGWVCLGSSP